MTMPTPKEFKKNAEDCLRLAHDTGELYAKMALIELATEFRVMAEHLVSVPQRHAQASDDAKDQE